MIEEDPKFGSHAQTPAQCAEVLVQLERATPGLVSKASAYSHQLYARYVARELSWAQVRDMPSASAS